MQKLISTSQHWKLNIRLLKNNINLNIRSPSQKWLGFFIEVIMIHIFVRTLFGYEHKKSVPIPNDVWQQILENNPTLNITVLGITYHRITYPRNEDLIIKLKNRMQLLGVRLPPHQDYIMFESTIESLSFETLDHFKAYDWFINLTRKE